MILQNFFISLFKYNVSDLDAGNYIVRANYSGNSLYAPASVNTTLAVNKKTTPGTVINITDLGKTTAGNATLAVEVPKNLTGNITVTIGDENYTAPITNGTATVDLTNVTPGEYNATVTYDGDDNNEPVSKNITVVISKADLDLQVNITEGNDTTPTVIDISVPVDFGGIILLKLIIKLKLCLSVQVKEISVSI